MKWFWKIEKYITYTILAFVFAVACFLLWSNNNEANSQEVPMTDPIYNAMMAAPGISITSYGFCGEHLPIFEFVTGRGLNVIGGGLAPVIQKNTEDLVQVFVNEDTTEWIITYTSFKLEKSCIKNWGRAWIGVPPSTEEPQDDNKDESEEDWKDG